LPIPAPTLPAPHSYRRRIKFPAAVPFWAPDQTQLILVNIAPVTVLENSIALLRREARLDGVVPNRFRTLTDPLLEVLKLDPIEAMEHDGIVALITQLLSHLADDVVLKTSEQMLQVYLDTLQTVVKELRH